MSLFIIDFDYRFPPTHLNNSTKHEGCRKNLMLDPPVLKRLLSKIAGETF